jgi:DNA-binding NtrC family response regulator
MTGQDADMRPPAGEFDDLGQETQAPSDGPHPARRRRKLLVCSEPSPITFELPDVGQVRIGRADQAEIRVNDPSISRLHAALVISESSSGDVRLEVEDLGSANGTRVRGHRLEPNERVPIAIGEAFDVGETMMLVQGPSSAGARAHRIWNHGDFEAKLEEECERAQATGSSFALIRVRAESKGRLIEKSALEELLARSIRRFDLMAQFAPGDYEILRIDCTPAQADALRSLLEGFISLELGAEPRIGVACYPSDSRNVEDLAALAGRRTRGGDAPPDRPSPVVVDQGPMTGLYRFVERIAPSEITVLILGETGVGKEVMAEAVHRASKRASRPFLRLNCAALSESLLESELFGHERGAFTGAAEAKPGLLESAQGGSIFLDEIGELPLNIQVKLLRVLEERTLLRVGGVKPRSIDARFIAATNRDLEADVQRKLFRHDLYYRLNGVAIVIPPLRERRSDIEPLARVFAARAAGTELEFSRDALDLLEAYHWPGNVRELRNLVERAVLLADKGPITREHLPVERLSAPMISISEQQAHAPPTAMLLPSDADPDDERQRILDALERCVGNQTRAAAMLGISRSTLVARLEQYRIPRPRKR